MTPPGDSSPLPVLLRPLGVLAEPVYRAVVSRRNARFDRREGVVEFDRPVISVGNISVGGTGKTPATLLLLRLLRERGHWPCVAMRGYASHNNLSDEAAEYRSALPDLPMVVQPDRTEGLLSLLASEAGSRVDCILLDDGFQHRRIARQLDIVLVDATRDPFADRLLPRGWLREPAESLSRAHAVVITHTEAVDAGVTQEIRRRTVSVLPAGCPVIPASHEWTSVTVSSPHALTSEPHSWLESRRALVCCAIGNPDAFIAHARRHTSIVGEIVLRDHDRYALSTVGRIRQAIAKTNADTLLVTAKDWTKLSRERWPCPVAVPSLALAMDIAPLEKLIDTVLPPRTSTTW